MNLFYNDNLNVLQNWLVKPWYNLSSRMSADWSEKAQLILEPSTFERELELINHRHGLRKRAIRII